MNNNSQQRLALYRDHIYQGRYSETIRQLLDEEIVDTTQLKTISECHHYVCEYYAKGMDDP